MQSRRRPSSIRDVPTHFEQLVDQYLYNKHNFRPTSAATAPREGGARVSRLRGGRGLKPQEYLVVITPEVGELDCKKGRE